MFCCMHISHCSVLIGANSFLKIHILAQYDMVLLGHYTKAYAMAMHYISAVTC